MTPQAELRDRSPEVTRFAPSPSGLLHLGHAYSALFAWQLAKNSGGRFLLRIEDIDGPRSRPEFATAILEDLAWLGLDWDEPPRHQSDHLADYAAALGSLEAQGLLYPCFCTRRDIREEIQRSASAPQGPEIGPEGPLYPGTCRRLSRDEGQARQAGGEAFALRLNSQAAARLAGALAWHERGETEIPVDPTLLGDVVLARKDIATSYHLAVTLDDADQGITVVTRGKDLKPTSHLHRLLQALLGLPVPQWLHHDLVTDETGQRLAKRNDALSLRALRESGRSPSEVRALAGFPD